MEKENQWLTSQWLTKVQLENSYQYGLCVLHSFAAIATTTIYIVITTAN